MATSYNICAICLEDFKQPKFLDCHHTFCLECLRGLENKTPGFINCPLCQRKVKLPSGGVDKLTTNFYFQDTLQGSEAVQRGYRPLQAVDWLAQAVDWFVQAMAWSIQAVVFLGQAVVQAGTLFIQAVAWSALAVVQALAWSMLAVEQAGTWSVPAVVQAGTWSVQAVVKAVKGQKLIEMRYHYYKRFIIRYYSGSGIKLDLCLKNLNGTPRLWIRLSESNKVIHSCNIDYDITFINHKDAECSIRSTGKAFIQSSQGYHYELKTVDVDLIRYQDAFNNNNGFIVKKSDDGLEYIYTFQLSVGITVSNIKKKFFSLK